MTLYEKGKNNFQQTLCLIDNLQQEISRQKCENNCMTYCPKCDSIQSIYRDYYVQILINRLYYSLYQILKSYLTNKVHIYIAHTTIYYDDENTGKKTNKIKTYSFIDKMKTDTRFSPFPTGSYSSLEQLRVLRNESDYQNSISTVRIVLDYKEKAEDIFQAINKLVLGEPKC